MATIAFVGVPAHGHINPTLAVVEELLHRGHRVVYYSTKAFEDKITSSGAEFRGYESIVEDIRTSFQFGAREVANVFLLSALVMEGTELLMPRLEADIVDLAPDLIVHDAVSVWGKLIARRQGIPAVASITTFALNMRAIMVSSYSCMQALRFLATSIPSLIRCMCASWRVRRQYGRPLRPLMDIFINEEPVNLVFTSTLFQPAADSFPNSYRFVGPSIRPTPPDPDFPWEALENTPVIYIAMGTIFNEMVAFYRLCFEAFRDWEGRVVMSVGANTDIAGLGPCPENFIVRGHVPQFAVLGRASVFITHGGMNSVSESILQHTPMVVVPQGADQFMVADRVAQLGAGIRLRPSSLDAGRLQASAEQVLAGQSYQERVAAIAQSYHEAGGYRRAVDVILEQLDSV